ncbi:MAG: NADH-quinone oxidoreductase subunit L [Dehalococcoidia bacterium]|nr:NADH-quinone oxidoreductase subunit L [Dehalococcoidia bacterium]
MNAESAWILPALPFAAFVILGLASLTGWDRRLPDRGSWLAVIAIAAGLVLFVPVTIDVLANGPQDYVFPWFAAGQTQLSLGLLVDPLTIVMLGLVTFVATCVAVYSTGYMHGEPRYAWYFAALSLFVASMLGLLLADNLLQLYICWELVGVCSYLLVGFYHERRSAAEAAKKAFITTRIGDVGMLIGILLLFQATGTFHIGDILAKVANGGLEPNLMTATALLLFLGAMGKSAQFPLHVWLPDAMEGPTPVSALIHAATMVAAGVYLVARMFPLFEAAPGALAVVTAIGAITTILGAGIALVMTDIKKVIAYSTISKLGFMMLTLGVSGYTAAIFYLVTHGFFKALLFLSAGSVIHGAGSQEAGELGGLRRHMPLTAWVFGIATLALAGIPPLSGFWSKDEAMLALSHATLPVYAISLVSVVLSSLYGGRLWLLTFTGAPRSHHAEHAHESPPVMTLPMLALAVMSVVSGFVALPAVGRAIGLPGGLGEFLYPPGGHPAPYHFDPAVAGISTFLAVAGLAIAAGFYLWRVWSSERLAAALRGLHQALARKLYLDDAYQAIIDYGALAMGKAIASFDRVFINDVGINGPGWLAVAAGGWLKLTQTGKVANYALGMIAGLLITAAAILTFFV